MTARKTRPWQVFVVQCGWGSEVRAELGAALIRHVSDPRLTQVVITRVEVTDDLQLAWVFVRVADEGHARRAQTGHEGPQGCRRSSPPGAGTAPSTFAAFPELRWRFDEGMDAQARVEELLREIHDEDEAKKA